MYTRRRMFRLRCQREFLTSFSSKSIKFLYYRVPMEAILLTGNLITGLINTTGIFSTEKVIVAVKIPTACYRMSKSSVQVDSSVRTNHDFPKIWATKNLSGPLAKIYADQIFWHKPFVALLFSVRLRCEGSYEDSWWWSCLVCRPTVQTPWRMFSNIQLYSKMKG